jgi:hypothetical protein
MTARRGGSRTLSQRVGEFEQPALGFFNQRGLNRMNNLSSFLGTDKQKQKNWEELSFFVVELKGTVPWTWQGRFWGDRLD